MDRDVLVPDDNRFGDGFEDLAFFRSFEVWPAAVEILGVGEDLIAGEQADFKEVELSLDSWDFGV